MSWEERDYARFGPQGGTGGFGMFASRAGTNFGDNPLNWAPTLGTLFGIRVRLHITFILYIVFELLRFQAGFTFILGSLVILFGSVLLHEFGHCFAARGVGGSADDILMWPLGGLASVSAPRQPWPQFITVVCGPLVNVALFVVAGGLLLVTGAQFVGFSLLPFQFFVPPVGYLGSFLYLTFSINLALFIFNLLPMYPMDGGRMLHCALWHKMGYKRGTMITTTVGMVVAILVGLYALLNRQYFLIAIAFMGYITCYQERLLAKAGFGSDENEFGYDFSGGYTTLQDEKKSRPGFFARWKQRRIEGRWRDERRKAQHLQDQVDAILEKVKRDGINSLSNREKKMLEEATKQQNSADRQHRVG